MKHDPDRHQDLISSCYSHTAPLQNILSEFGSIFSSCPANKQTNRQMLGETCPPRWSINRKYSETTV